MYLFFFSNKSGTLKTSNMAYMKGWSTRGPIQVLYVFGQIGGQRQVAKGPSFTVIFRLEDFSDKSNTDIKV